MLLDRCIVQVAHSKRMPSIGSQPCVNLSTPSGEYSPDKSTTVELLIWNEKGAPGGLGLVAVGAGVALLLIGLVILAKFGMI